MAGESTGRPAGAVRLQEPMTDAVTIRRLTDGADPAVGGVEPIYVSALPACERKPVSWLRSLPGRADYRLLLAEAAGAVVGFAVLFVPTGPADAALLEYMAVAESARGGGVGGRLLAEALRAAGRPVLIEVQSADADAGRRRAFYRRHGCRDVVGLRYLCPLPDAPPMTLMVGGAAAVSRDPLSRWLSTVYADVYGQRRDDPRVAVMTAQLANPVLLG